MVVLGSLEKACDVNITQFKMYSFLEENIYIFTYLLYIIEYRRWIRLGTHSMIYSTRVGMTIRRLVVVNRLSCDCKWS